MFIDKARIFVTAGRGGAGCISFRREKYVPMGGPDGGNGGKGGDIYVEADLHLKTLLEVAFRPHIRAKDGQAGGSGNKYGKGGEDLIKVPAGTVIYKNKEAFADLKIHPARLLSQKAEGEARETPPLRRTSIRAESRRKRRTGGRNNGRL